MTVEELKGKRIAIPGKLTTAYLALRLMEPDFQAVEVPFDKILDAVTEGRADAGLIIHEAQLTYSKSGFHNIVDLGRWWKNKYDLPLPLGANVLRRDLAPEIGTECCRLMRESIQYALDHREEALDLRDAVCPRHGTRAGGEIRGHVRQPLHRGLRRTCADGGAETARHGF